MLFNLRALTDIAGKDVKKGFLAIFLLTFVPVLGSLSIILAAVVTLRRGAFFGFLLTIAATLPYFIMLPMQDGSLGLWFVILISLSNFSTWLLATLKQRGINWSKLLTIVLWLGMVIVLGFHAVIADAARFWEQQLTKYWIAAITASSNANSASSVAQIIDVGHAAVLDPEILSFIKFVKNHMTGIASILVLLGALLQVYFAYIWCGMRADMISARSPILRNMRLGWSIGLAFITVIIMSYMRVPCAVDLLPFFYAGFALPGLSIVHFYCACLGDLSWLALVVFYTVLCCSWAIYHFPLLVQLVALFALLDVWLNLRSYKAIIS